MFKHITDTAIIPTLEGDIHDIIDTLTLYVSQNPTAESLTIQEEWYSYEDFNTVLVISRKETQAEYDARLEVDYKILADKKLAEEHALALIEEERLNKVTELYKQLKELGEEVSDERV